MIFRTKSCYLAKTTESRRISLHLVASEYSSEKKRSSSSGGDDHSCMRTPCATDPNWSCQVVRSDMRLLMCPPTH